MSKIIRTPQGDVRLISAPAEIIELVDQLLPLGLDRFSATQYGADYGIIVQRGDKEMFGVKQQPPECDLKQGDVNFLANTLLITHSLHRFSETGFSGLLLPSSYLVKKTESIVESGISYFGAPSLKGKECLDFPFAAAFDDGFGHGFTKLLTSFFEVLKESSRQIKITLPRCIGLDVRPRSRLGKLGFGFLVVDSHIACIKTQLSEDDPVWTVLRHSGVQEVFHLPSIPLAISDEY